jgi:RNAse (barnase) inhibitor barstar
MTLWQIITGNSTLPIQAGNTFWDHLNNQNTGTGSGYTSTIDILTADIQTFVLEANIQVLQNS